MGLAHDVDTGMVTCNAFLEILSSKATYAGYNKGMFNVYLANLTDEKIVFYTNDGDDALFESAFTERARVDAVTFFGGNII